MGKIIKKFNSHKIRYLMLGGQTGRIAAILNGLGRLYSAA